MLPLPWLNGFTSVTVGYVALVSADLRIDGVPVKLILTATLLAVWTAARGRRRMLRTPGALGALLLGAVVPIAWLGVSLLRSHAGDPAQRAGIHFALQEASHFGYVLLYFPLSDLVRRQGLVRAGLAWRLPVACLCAATIVVAALHGVGLDVQSGLLAGAGSDRGTLRIMLASDILLVPTLTMTLAMIWAHGPTAVRWLEVAALLLTTHLAHSRGLWVGETVAVVSTAAVVGAAALPRRRAAAAATATALAALGAVLMLADPAVARAVLGRGALSATADLVRLQQAPQLLRGVARHLWAGSGLGATLPTGYFRSFTSPWSFELEYPQLLFQVGIVGTALTAVLPGATAWRCARLLRHDRIVRMQSAGGLGALVGTLVAGADNPYILSASGMLALAVLATWADGLTPAAAPSASFARRARRATGTARR